ncbi:MAG: AI-2E family transporter [Sphingobacteriia bacterium]|nr:AI-2E family transporter [Sphingobacteriia bacterium]NCC38515.1 AI-2E family transporter [Gammaproteobacteria bacterium]
MSTPARGVIVLAALALVVLAVKAAAPILVPLLLAVFIAIITTPALKWMSRKGMPKWFALGVIGFVLLDIGSLLALISTGALEGFRDSLPTYQERFFLLSEQFGGWLEGKGISGSREAIPDLFDPNQVASGVRILLSNASSLFATGLLVLLAVIFILMEVTSLPAKLDAAFGMSDAGRARLARLLFAIRRYMLIKTLTSLGTALCVWVWLWLLGIDFAVLWALLAFFLNFIPVVGNVLMAIPPTLLALVQTDLATTWLVLVGFVVINLVIGNVLEPRVMGKGLGISTLAVFVALLFWGWLLGAVGMFLAVPLTAALIIALESSPHTRPIAILLGPPIKPELEAGTQPSVPDDASARSVD